MLNGSPFIVKGVIFEFPMVPVHLFGLTGLNTDQESYLNRHIEARDYYFGQGAYVGRGALSIMKPYDLHQLHTLHYKEDLMDPMTLHKD